LSASVERWRLVAHVLDEALELDDARRAEYLARACQGDPALRAEVERWLGRCRESGWFLDVPADRFARPLLAGSGIAAQSGGRAPRETS
jgi:hypothetical protein